MQGAELPADPLLLSNTVWNIWPVGKSTPNEKMLPRTQKCFAAFIISSFILTNFFRRVFDIIHKMVTEHNIIFLSSAGNDGPALSTVGAPPAISNEIIGKFPIMKIPTIYILTENPHHVWKRSYFSPHF